jgi:hypothetical protein
MSKNGVMIPEGWFITEDAAKQIGLPPMSSNTTIATLKRLGVHKLTSGGDDGKKPMAFLWCGADFNSARERFAKLAMGKAVVSLPEERVRQLADRVEKLEGRVRNLEDAATKPPEEQAAEPTA